MKTIKKISMTLATMLLGLVVVGLCPFMGMKAEAAVNLNDSIYSDGNFHAYTGTELTNCDVKFVDGILSIKSNGPDAEIKTSAFYFGGDDHKIERLDIIGDPYKIKIGATVFYMNIAIEKVTLSGVTSIGRGTFQNCKNLKEVILPDEIDIILDMMFKNCDELEDIIIPDGVEEIEGYVFQGCNKLKSITFPASLNIAGDIFGYSKVEEGIEPLIEIEELIFRGDVPTNIDTKFKNWLKDPGISGSSGSLNRIVVPDEHIEAYIVLLEGCGISPDRVNELVVKYSEAFPNGRDDDRDDNDDGHEGGGSNDDESRPAPPTPNQMAQELILRLLEEQIAAMDSSSNRQATIDGNELVNGLPNATMKRIADTPNAVVFFKFIYDGVHYTTAIPTDAVFDTSVDWYGPLYMMNVFPTMQETATGAVPYVPVVAPVQ